MEYMCTKAETEVTTTSITAVSVSIRSDHSTVRLPDAIQVNTGTRAS